MPPIDKVVMFTSLRPVISFELSRITALLAEAVPAVTPSKTAISVPAISASPIINVPPVKYNLRHGLSEEPKSYTPYVVGNRSADILFVSNPPPTVESCTEVKFLKFKNSLVNLSSESIDFKDFILSLSNSFATFISEIC